MSSLGPAPTETWTRSLHAASRDAAGPPVPGAAGAERTRVYGLSGGRDADGGRTETARWPLREQPHEAAHTFANILPATSVRA